MNLKGTLWYILASCLVPGYCQAQEFSRNRLQVELESPWEIIYGPDDHLWISEKQGQIVRVSPVTGEATTVFAAADYSGGFDSERAPCGLGVGANTYGMALHPEFLDPASAFIYLIYSYNNGTDEAPETLFKIAQLTWDAASNSITASEDLVNELANGFDHFGGRLIAATQEGKNYLYYSTGDTGANVEGCYATEADNPNNTTQDPYTKVGKIHRINIDGTIPGDNPIPGNSFFTRGHRNPQGLAYNPNANVVYDIEHGHTTDDEINVLEAGMNYGWKNVQGYHDGNYPDELAYVQNYTPHPDIPGDMLKEPLYAWGAVPQTGGGFPSWPTVAPSDGIYYGSSGIPEWTNSLLVVTLKDGDDTDQQVYQFSLNPDGKSLTPSTPENPNPRRYFKEDQFFNGRLRDIAVSTDGKQLFLITSNRDVNNPIIVYTFSEPVSTLETGLQTMSVGQNVPNPFSVSTNIRTDLKKAGHLRIEITDMLGRNVRQLTNQHLPAGSFTANWDGRNDAGQSLPNGIYLYTAFFDHARSSRKMLLAK